MGKSAGLIFQIVAVALMFIPGIGTALGISLLGMRLIAATLMIAGGLLSKIDTKFEQNGHLVNARSTDETVPVLYGEQRIGGNQVFMTTTGSENEYIHIIQTFSEGEINSVIEVWLDDKLSTDSFYDGHVYTEVFPGTQTQNVCQTLKNVFPDWNDAMRGTAYIYVRLKFNPDKFQSVPLITVKARGRKLYDPRDGQTVWSQNGALAIYDILINKTYAFGLDSSIIDIQSIKDAANKIDTMGYTFNCLINSREPVLDIIDRILINFRGFLIYTDGIYKLRIYDYDSPVMNITDDDIIEDSFEITAPGLPETPNRLKVKFVDPTLKYTVNDFIFEDPATITIDGMERENELNLTGCTSYDQATEIATFQFERQRINKTYSCAIGSKGASLELGDILSCTYPFAGWIDQSCRVVGIDYQPNYDVGLMLVEEFEEFYDKKLNITSHTYFSGNFNNPNAVPPPVGNVVITEEIATNKDLTYSRYKVTFTKPQSIWWDYAEVWVSTNGTEYKHYTDAVNEFFIEPVEDGKTYYFKLVSVNIYGVKEDIDNASVWSRQVQGKNIPPSNVTGFVAIASGDNISCRWNPVTDIDLVGYEIRRGDSWGAGVIFTIVKNIAYIVSGIKPGVHKLWIKAKDTIGNYSASASSVELTVFYPPGYTDKHSWTTDFTDGTHNNTAYKDDPTYGRVLYVVSGLAGDWTSPVYDMTALKDMRFWSLYDLIQIGDETIWSGKYGTDDIWGKYNAGMTWGAIFEQMAATGFEIKFYHSPDSSNWFEIPYFHIFSPEVNCRYVKYKIFLTNLNENTYLYAKPTTLKGAYWK